MEAEDPQMNKDTVLRKLIQEGLTIIGDYQYIEPDESRPDLIEDLSVGHHETSSDRPKTSSVPSTPGTSATISFRAIRTPDYLHKPKSSLYLKDRILLDLKTMLAEDTSLSEDEREDITDAFETLSDYVREIVVTKETYSSVDMGHYVETQPKRSKPTIHFVLVNIKSVHFITDQDDPASKLFIEKLDELEQINVREPLQEWIEDNLLKRQLSVDIANLRQQIFNNPEHEEIRRTQLASVVGEYLLLPILQKVLNNNLFVDVDVDSLKSGLKPPKPPQKRRIKKAHFAPPGEISDGNTKMSFHAVRQLFTPKNMPTTSPEQIKLDWVQKTGVPIERDIDRYGIDLTNIQYKVMEGILAAFSKTQYKGNLPSKLVTESLREQNIRFKDKGSIPEIYKNIVQIPRIQITQRDLMRMSGIDENNKSEMIDGLEALAYLSTTQFCFYYTRMAVNQDGKPLFQEKSNDYKKEEVQAIDKLFTVKQVRDEETKAFKYYEITPSPIFLDQLDGYFLLVPRGWMEEVRSKVGVKRASSYTIRFLLYLRFAFEDRRRINSKPSTKKKLKYEIKSDWRQLAKELKMPQSVYVGQRKRALALMEDAYSTALQLGYLTAYERGDDDICTLVLNAEKYPAPKE